MITFLKDWFDRAEFDFVGWRWPAGIVSTVMVILSWVLFFTVGPNWGIDFTGGTEIVLKFDQAEDIGEVRGALHDLGLSDDAVQRVGGTDEAPQYSVRIQDAEFGASELREEVVSRLTARYGADWIENSRFSAEVGARLDVWHTGDAVAPAEVAAVLSDLQGVKVEQGRDDNQIVIKLPGLSQQIKKEIATVMGSHTFEVLSVDAVGPKVGGDLRRQGFVAILATLVLILIYVAFRFDIAFAPGAVLALFHDVSVTIGIFIILQRQFDLPMIGALLTIVGYSLNDTIVIYDRIRENTERYRRQDTAELINTSINETLSRTFGTSFTTLLSISVFLFMGGDVIKNFALAMLCGITFGTYSTVYVASPMILLMEDLKPYLSRFVAISGGGDDDDDGRDPTDEASLTETEKRRRERARTEPQV